VFLHLSISSLLLVPHQQNVELSRQLIRIEITINFICQRQNSLEQGFTSSMMYKAMQNVSCLYMLKEGLYDGGRKIKTQPCRPEHRRFPVYTLAA
jgi:hypothetical protein